MAFREMPDAGHAFVDRVVDVEVTLLQVLAALAAPVGARRQDSDLTTRAIRDHEGTARHVTGFVDQGQGGGPQRVVQRRVVQGRNNSRQSLAPFHNATSLPIPRTGLCAPMAARRLMAPTPDTAMPTTL